MITIGSWDLLQLSVKVRIGHRNMSGRAAPGVVTPVVLLLSLAVFLQQFCSVLPQKSKKEEEYEKRPYKFQFNIEDHHHRKEEKNEKGIIMGEFGFVTADFFYLTTVYATDEEGKFHILSRSRKYIGPPTEKPPTRNFAAKRPTTVTPPPQQIKAQTEPIKPLTTEKPNRFVGLNGCSNCIVPTKKPPNDINVNDDRKRFPIIGVNPVRGQGNGRSEIPSTGRPGNFPSKSPTRQKADRPGSFTRPGAPIDPSNPLRTGQLSPGKQISPNRPNRPGSSINPTPQNRPGLGGVNQQRDGQAGLGQSGAVKGDQGGPNYKFNYTVGFHGHHEIGYKGGSKEGGYFANYRNGEGQRVVYEANEFGFQPNVTKVQLTDTETPKEETEKDFGLKGYEFIWFK